MQVEPLGTLEYVVGHEELLVPQSVSVGPWSVQPPLLPHVATVSQPWTTLSPYSQTRPAGMQEPPVVAVGTVDGQGPVDPLELPPELLPLPEPLDPPEAPELPEPPPDAPLDPLDPPFDPPPLELPPFELAPLEAPELLPPLPELAPELVAPELLPPPLPLPLVVPSPFAPLSFPSPLLVNAEPPQATSRTSTDPPTTLRARFIPEA